MVGLCSVSPRTYRCEIDDLPTLKSPIIAPLMMMSVIGEDTRALCYNRIEVTLYFAPDAGSVCLG